jgi:hypothetical protein
MRKRRGRKERNKEEKGRRKVLISLGILKF